MVSYDHDVENHDHDHLDYDHHDAENLLDPHDHENPHLSSLRALLKCQMVSYDHDVANHDHDHLDYDPHDNEDLLDPHLSSLRALLLEPLLSSPDERAPSLRSVLT